MKTIVAIACAAVIAYIGYFFWGEWRSAEEQSAAITSARYLECVEYSKGSVDRIAKVHEMSIAERSVMNSRAEECAAIIGAAL